MKPKVQKSTAKYQRMTLCYSIKKRCMLTPKVQKSTAKYQRMTLCYRIKKRCTVCLPPPPPSGWVSLRGFFFISTHGGGRGGRKCKHRSETRYKTNIIYVQYSVLSPLHTLQTVTEILLGKNLSFPLYCITPRKPLCDQGLGRPRLYVRSNIFTC